MNKLDLPKKTTLNIDDKLLQAAKERADIEGVTLSEWLARAVDLYLTNHWKIDVDIYLMPDDAKKLLRPCGVKLGASPQQDQSKLIRSRKAKIIVFLNFLRRSSHRPFNQTSLEGVQVLLSPDQAIQVL